MLVIFVRDVSYDCVRECSAQSVGTGLLGMMVPMCVLSMPVFAFYAGLRIQQMVFYCADPFPVVDNVRVMVIV